MNATEKTMARDVVTRAAHTAWQAAAATAATLWAASGMHVADLAHASGWAHLWTAVAVGVLGAALSAAKTSVIGYAAAHRAQLDRLLVQEVTAQLTSLQTAAPADPAPTAGGPTLIGDTHPILADPDRAAADTAPQPPEAGA